MVACLRRVGAEQKTVSGLSENEHFTVLGPFHIWPFEILLIAIVTQDVPDLTQGQRQPTSARDQRYDNLFEISFLFVVPPGSHRGRRMGMAVPITTRLLRSATVRRLYRL
jgi:hypothetical protein